MVKDMVMGYGLGYGQEYGDEGYEDRSLARMGVKVQYGWEYEGRVWGGKYGEEVRRRVMKERVW